MALAYWGLSESPFRESLDPRFFFLSPTHEEALARLDFLVTGHRRVGLVLAESGVGKSLLLDVFARESRLAGRQVARANLLGNTAGEVLWQLATQLGITPTRQITAVELWRSLVDCLVENRYQHLDTVLLLDDADECSEDVASLLVRLAHLDLDPAARLTVVLSSQPRRLAKLNERLLELSELRIDLEAWAAEDTSAFVTEALAAVGRSQRTFTPEALTRLHNFAGGVPRRVKQLADLCLMAGAGSELKQIEPSTVDSVYSELGVISIGAPLSISTPISGLGSAVGA